MSDHFADRLLEASRQKGAPVCVGLDPVYERLPAVLRDGGPPDPRKDATAACAVIHDYCLAVIDAVADHVPAIKPQSACFERYLWPGVRVLRDVIAAARQRGLIVIHDAKRGDIGVTAAHYAAGGLVDTGYSDLQSPPGPDAMTVNGYLGEDSLEPLIEAAIAQGKGLFVMVRTSNPGSDALQTLKLSDGRTVSDVVAEMVARLGDKHIGESGYSAVGAVVGATKPVDAAGLRRRMAQQIFLVPGYGAQGGSAADVRACFNDDGTGALVTASRSVIYAYEKRQGDWKDAVAQGARELRDQIAAALA
jgi:orotidine-5'-phosphate decarboxylase